MGVAKAEDRMRTIVHPGTPLVGRAQSVPVILHPTIRLTVDVGGDLFDTIHATLKAADAAGGSFILVGGDVARLSLMTGGQGEGIMPMGFLGPHDLAAPLRVVAGAGGSGLDEDGSPFSHCHAAFRNASGKLVGGHLIPGQTIAGSGGIAVDLVPIARGRFARRHDSETRFTIFHPEAA